MSENQVIEKKKEKPQTISIPGMPSSAFVSASWCMLIIGAGAYLIGLWNLYYNDIRGIELSVIGIYVVLLLFGMFSVVSLQKAVRDIADKIPTTPIYYGICWFGIVSSLGIMTLSLSNAPYFTKSEKGFYAMAFLLALYSCLTVQKNVRDIVEAKSKTKKTNKDNDLV